jgi:hypothetical protein
MVLILNVLILSHTLLFFHYSLWIFFVPGLYLYNLYRFLKFYRPINYIIFEWSLTDFGWMFLGKTSI